MKPRNFPARKAARKLAADIRALGSRRMTCQSPGVMTSKEVLAARSIRTKKNRGQ